MTTVAEVAAGVFALGTASYLHDMPTPRTFTNTLRILVSGLLLLICCSGVRAEPGAAREREELVLLNELQLQGAGRETYRITWYQVHLGYMAASIRVDIQLSKVAFATLRETSTAILPGERPTLVVDRAIPVSAAQVAHLRDAIRQSEFWKAESEVYSAQCVLRQIVTVEVLKDGALHAVSWSCASPDALSPLLNVFEQLTMQANAKPR